MPNLKSAKKRLRQDAKKRLRNRMQKSRIHTTIRRFREALAEGNLELAAKKLSEAAAYLDKAAKRNIIHPNKASRLKSRLQVAYNRKAAVNA